MVGQNALDSSRVELSYGLSHPGYGGIVGREDSQSRNALKSVQQPGLLNQPGQTGDEFGSNGGKVGRKSDDLNRDWSANLSVSRRNVSVKDVLNQ